MATVRLVAATLRAAGPAVVLAPAGTALAASPVPGSTARVLLVAAGLSAPLPGTVRVVAATLTAATDPPPTPRQVTTGALAARAAATAPDLVTVRTESSTGPAAAFAGSPGPSFTVLLPLLGRRTATVRPYRRSGAVLAGAARTGRLTDGG